MRTVPALISVPPLYVLFSARISNPFPVLTNFAAPPPEDCESTLEIVNDPLDAVVLTTLNVLLTTPEVPLYKVPCVKDDDVVPALKVSVWLPPEKVRVPKLKPVPPFTIMDELAETVKLVLASTYPRLPESTRNVPPASVTPTSFVPSEVPRAPADPTMTVPPEILKSLKTNEDVVAEAEPRANVPLPAFTKPIVPAEAEEVPSATLNCTVVPAATSHVCAVTAAPLSSNVTAPVN